MSTGDVALTSTYWHQAATVVDLWITVENTGQITERVGLRYTLPSGVTDVGTPGCGSAGPDSYACAAWTAHAGARWSTRLKLRIAGDAWKAMPLRGSVQVTATAAGHPGAGEVADDHGFAVLFPAGSPPGGITVTGTAGGLAAVGRSAGGTTDVRHLALTLIGVSTLLILLALTLAVTSLRRRLSEDPLPPAAPAAAPVD
ncbi:MAG TPA: hypothetical protein VF462_09820 [Micromonosporaceae bacterium]